MSAACHRGTISAMGTTSKNRTMSKDAVVAVIQRELASVMSERNAAIRDPETHAARLALRRFQAGRMAATHADLLADPEYRAAAQFFLNDLYGTEDLTGRDANLERVIPSMEKLLPVAALETVAKAIALDALSERLDAAMARELGTSFSASDYVDAYVKATRREDRERQLDHVETVGATLCELVRVPLIGSTLAMMRGPAKLAKLADLHSFLERGFLAFKKMHNPNVFVETVVMRERTIMANLYAGRPDPFTLVP